MKKVTEKQRKMLHAKSKLAATPKANPMGPKASKSNHLPKDAKVPKVKEAKGSRYKAEERTEKAKMPPKVTRRNITT